MTLTVWLLVGSGLGIYLSNFFFFHRNFVYKFVAMGWSAAHKYQNSCLSNIWVIILMFVCFFNDFACLEQTFKTTVGNLVYKFGAMTRSVMHTRTKFLGVNQAEPRRQRGGLRLVLRFPSHKPPGKEQDTSKWGVTGGHTKKFQASNET